MADTYLTVVTLSDEAEHMHGAEQLELLGVDAGGPEVAASSALEASDEVWEEAQRLAAEIKGKALIPVLGAGASYPCRTPLAADLGQCLVDAIADGRITLGETPSDYASISGDRDCRPANVPDLGRLADLVCLEHEPEVVLEELGLADSARWPSGQAIAKGFAAHPHACAYRVLARMSRERFFTEALTFNFDCNFEGALLKEGFQPNSRSRSSNLWPERFDVVADARSNAQLLPRADFVLNKVHGCAQTWRERKALITDARERRAADDAIVIRWTQLLNWRSDFWARDLFRDRARRHVLVLIGFSGNDPVIHSSLRSVLEEIRATADEPVSRVRVIDIAPDTLSLRLLTAAGRAKESTEQMEQLAIRDAGLTASLLIIHSQLLRLVLEEEAEGRGETAPIAVNPREALLQLAVAAPAMLRWTVALLQATPAIASGTGELIDQFGDDLYVPLSANAARSLRLLQTEQQLRSHLDLSLRDDNPLMAAGFYRRHGDARVFVATGLNADELAQAAHDGTLRSVGERLTVPADLVPIAVAAAEDGLCAYAVETGRCVSI